jgi:hypothetical protein
MIDPAVRSECDRSRRPDQPNPSQRVQGWSSKAEGLRVSGLCLTEPSTLAISSSRGKHDLTGFVTPAVCPIYWWQNSECSLRFDVLVFSILS